MNSLRTLLFGAALLGTLPAAPLPSPAPAIPPAQQAGGAEARNETQVAPGLRYIHLRKSSDAGEPWSIHILELDRRQKTLELRAVVGSGDEEEMQRRRPSALGERAGALAVVNGDFDIAFPYLGISDGLTVTSGRLWTTGQPRRPAMAVLPSGEPVIAVPQVKLELRSGERVWPLGALNKPFGSPHGGEPRIFTREFRALLVSEVPFSAAVIAELDPPLPLRADGPVRGVVQSLANDASELAIPPGALVVARRAGALELAAGDAVELRIETRIAGRAGAREVIGGFPVLVEEGRAVVDAVPAHYLGQRHPRTATCYNERKIIFTVVDGRQAELSVGMTLEELAELMVSLGCTVAMNTDGGGSSVMTVALPPEENSVGARVATPLPSNRNMRIVNSPSDGRERGRGNAWVIVPRR